MNNRQILGVGLLALVALIIFGVTKLPTMIPSLVPPTQTLVPNQPGTCPNATTHVYSYGGYRYFQNPAIMQILCEKYGIEVKGEFEMGGYAMSDKYPHSDPNITVDCTYPASRITVEYFAQNHPGKIRQSVVTSTDLNVIYTWRAYLPTLMRAGIVTQQNQVYFVNMKPLVDAMLSNKQWADIGVAIPGPVRIETTDPAASTGGAVWMAYVGSFVVPGNETGSKPLTMTELQANDTILPELYTYWEFQGGQIDTTVKLFNTFISRGEGIPMAVAYETSFVAWLSKLSVAAKSRAQDIVGLYPNPTVGAELTLVSVDKDCDQLQHILVEDKDIISIARQNSGVCPPGAVCDPIASAPWLRDNVTFPVLVPEPKKDVTDAIQNYIKACSAATPGSQCAPGALPTPTVATPIDAATVTPTP